jgi:2-polyprenyl-6-hydroxyphenyl methylase/3-demethylubiquinone-9 3-methyltransferase
VLGRLAAGQEWLAEEKSVFDLDPAAMGRFDVVHSWGVLHHTGAMWRAIEACLPMVAPGGLLVLAFYRKTPLCGFWRAEKRFYTSAGAVPRAVVRGIYAAAYVLGLIASGRNPAAYIRDYRRNRGMAWMTDVEDWLGGYPYESVSPEELDAFLTQRGFARERIFTKPARLGGLFGSHCDEFVYRRI